MQKWKKIMVGMLSTCLMMTYVPEVSELGRFIHTKFIVQAATTDVVVSGTCGEKATWEYNRDTKVLTIGGTGKTDSYKETWENYKEDIKKIVVGDDITEITDYTFASFTAVEQVQFGSSVKKIGNHAFDGCVSLKNVELGGNIEELGVRAFASCENLTNVSIGKALKIVYWDVFKGCNALNNIKIDEQNKNILVEGNTLKNAKISGNCGELTSSGTFGKNIKYTYDYETKTLTLRGTGSMYNGSADEDVGVDDEEEYYYNFFSQNPNKKIIKEEMEKVVIGDGITKIGRFAFSECKSLKEVKLGKDVQEIGKSAFYGCTALKKINWTDNIEEIRAGAFRCCYSLKKLYVGESLKKIKDTSFFGCSKLEQIKVHKANKNFSKRGNMLLNKKQTKLILGCFASDTTCHIYGSITHLNSYAIEEENIENFKVSSKNKQFSSKNGLLYSKDGKTLYRCPRGKKGTAIVSGKAAKMKKYKYYSAFEACDKLQDIIIGKNIKVLDYCFGGCSKLKKVNIRKGNKYYVWEDGAIFSKNKKKLICCIQTKNGTYTVPKGVTSIAKDAFDYCGELKHIVLSDNITDYKPNCFIRGYSNMPQIESITFGKNYYNGGKVQFLSSAHYLKAIYVSEENPYYSSVDGILYNKEQTKLLVFPSACTDVCKMPKTVTSVKGNYNSNIKELYVSDGITDMQQIWK